MALEIHEYSSGEFKAEFVEDVQHSLDMNLTEADGDLQIDPNSLMVDIEGIHAYPHATRNFTRYMPKCLKGSIPSWTKPYNRPLIRHHNEKDGDIIGRVISADYKKDKTFSGTPALLFTVNIPGEEAKAAIKNGTESTVSIGVIAHDVRCSICGHQLGSGTECEHERGATYNGETCYWDIYSMEAKELSYVIVPSDIYAKNVKVYSASKGSQKSLLTESFDNTIQKKGEKLMPTDKDKDNDLNVSEALEQKVKELEAQNAEITKAKADLEVKMTEMTETKTALETKIEELNKTIDTMKVEATEAAAMKEGLETALEEAKVACKESLIDTAQAWRTVLGKSAYADDDIKNRSEEAIRCAITDMKEDYDSSHKEVEPELPGKITSPEVVESEEDTKKKIEMKEKIEKLRNVNLEEGLSSLFSPVAARR